MAEYIDKEAALKKFERIKESCVSSKDAFYIDAVIANIGALPTVDAKPVVHGEWIEVSRTEGRFETLIEEKCSLCGRYVNRYDTQPKDKYCPNCGAKMDRQKEGK